MAKSTKVIHISNTRPSSALNALNRITGLDWGRMPKSLVNDIAEAAQVECEEEPNRAQPSLMNTMKAG
ncbi:hypothetical protein [Hahella sp. NBU794]|uniref:hypothetical protein n=1 Tax=Hahella sp. NBU794 TaxID=3422590 RepID=UPI003D6F508E